MALPFLLENPDLVDKMLLGTTLSPGKLTLSGHDRDKDWNTQKAKGQTGASSTLNGDPLGEFDARFDLADAEDQEAWDDFQRLIDSTVNGAKPVALPVYQVDLARNRFTEVVLRKMGGMVWNGDGSSYVVVKFGEHRPPAPKPPAKATPKPAQTMATTDEGRRSPPDPNAAAKAELAALREEAAAP
jgi:hypothetical protein